MALDYEMEGEHALVDSPERVLMSAVLSRAARDLCDPHFMRGPEGEELVEWLQDETPGNGHGFTFYDLCHGLDLDIEVARSVMRSIGRRSSCSLSRQIRMGMRVKSQRSALSR